MFSQASWMHNLWCFYLAVFLCHETFSSPQGAYPLLPLAPWVISAFALQHEAGFCGVNVSAMGMKDRLTWLNQNKSLNKDLSQTGEFVSIQWVLKCYIKLCWRIFRLHVLQIFYKSMDNKTHFHCKNIGRCRHHPNSHTTSQIRTLSIGSNSVHHTNRASHRRLSWSQ